MKKDFTHENFERFLKENADELQLRPADGVWNRIENRLNRRRRRVLFTSGIFLLTASLFGYFLIDQSKQPSDPFANVHVTTQKNRTAPETVTTQRTATTGTALPVQTKQSLHQLASGRSSKTPVAAQLFQKPIAPSLPDIVAAKEGAGTNQSAAVSLVPLGQQKPAELKTPLSVAQQSYAHSEVPRVASTAKAFQPKTNRRKSEFQLFFSPGVSYRRLTENKSYLRAVPQNLASSNFAALYNVKNMVTHKPDIGLELGAEFKIPVTSRVKLRTGMQFNIMRYSIKAFTYVPERTTIALNTRSHGVDSVSTISSYRNFNGANADWLQNFYFQISAPVGVEVALTPAASKTRFGIATTIQPTYVLGDRAYLLSTDYKNYSQVPWLIRRWNANTSLEAFVSYSTGKLRWQVGPQVRYQLLSSFIQQYPVKENLFDFGMKVGVSLDKK